MVGDDVDWLSRTLQIVSPRTKSLEDSEKLLIMHVIVQLRHGEAAVTVDFDQIQWASTRGPIDA